MNDFLPEFREISYHEAIDFLLPRHYSGRKPPITIAFGWFLNGTLKAVCTFGKPASNSLCRGVCGFENSTSVYELNRLCKDDDFEFQLSQFVSLCLRALKPKNWIVVSYADTGMYHVGYVYQASNFIYTGMTKERTDKYVESGKHYRHYERDKEQDKRLLRTSKHRYIYFCTNSKRVKCEWSKSLNYPILPYPKGDIKRYKLGNYMQPTIITREGNDNANN